MDLSKFKFSDDFLTLSKENFKTEMKNRYGLKVREINELYKQLHGFNIDDVPEVEDAKE